LHEREDIYDFFDLIIIFGLVIFLILTLKKDWKEYIRFAIVILLLTANLILFVEITKFLCGRVRFRDLNSNYSNYTPWFLPPGPDSNNNSFPSGHAALGWIFLPLLILIKDYKWKDPIRILISMFVIGWGLFVAISRVLIGAHYASDVLFSSGAAAIITIFLYKWFYLNKKEKK
jgi:membrane-associated phospholipid phosphatase